MGIAKYKRKQEAKKIWLDEQETVYVVGRPYIGKKFTAQSLRYSAKYKAEMRLALKKDDWDKQAELSTLIGLEAVVGAGCITEIGDTEGFKVTGKLIVELLQQDEWAHLRKEIDNALDSSSDEFTLSEEDAVEEGKLLRSIIGGGGEQNETKKA